MLSDKYWVYVLQNSTKQLYIGHTSNLEKRLAHHLKGDSRWTSSRGPWSLVYSEEYPTRAQAMKRERELKTGRANQQLRFLIDHKPR